MSPKVHANQISFDCADQYTYMAECNDEHFIISSKTNLVKTSSYINSKYEEYFDQKNDSEYEFEVVEYFYSEHEFQPSESSDREIDEDPEIGPRST